MRTVDILKEMFRGDTETFEVNQHRRRGIRASKMVFDIEIQILFQLTPYLSPISGCLW